MCVGGSRKRGEVLQVLELLLGFWLVSRLEELVLVQVAMEYLPEYAMSIVLSRMDTRGLCRCACIAKGWASCVEQRRLIIRKNAAIMRSRVHQL